MATEEGNHLRQEAGDATDRFFDAAWSGLGKAETEDVKCLPERLARALELPEEDVA